VDNPFFERPILNSPYEYPARHRELDESGQPTRKIVEAYRRAEFITPIPKPRKRKASAAQASLRFDEGKALSTGVDPVSWTPTDYSQEVFTMPKTHAPYAPESRRQRVELVRSGRTLG